MIGKDPATGGLHVWTFEDDGGIGDADITRDGKKWVFAARGVDGRRPRADRDQHPDADRRRLVPVAVGRADARTARRCPTCRRSRSPASRPSRNPTHTHGGTNHASDNIRDRGGGRDRARGGPRLARPARRAAAAAAGGAAGAAVGGGGGPRRRRWPARTAGPGVGTRSAGTVVGPAGGTRTAGTGQRVVHDPARDDRSTTPGPARGGTTPGGVTAGRGVGGVQVTTPGGQRGQQGRHGRRGIAGPGGNAVGSRTGVTTGSGPGGSFGTRVPRRRRRRPAGRGGRRARGSARRPGRAEPSPAAPARGGRGRPVRGRRRPHDRRARDGRNLLRAPAPRSRPPAATVRTNFRTTVHSAHLVRHATPARWVAAGWTAARSGPPRPGARVHATAATRPSRSTTTTARRSSTPATRSSSTARPEVPGRDSTPSRRPTSPTTGKAGRRSTRRRTTWQPLGVFAMVGEGETKSTNIFQLAVNKDGVIRGNYYNALTDTTEPVYGSVDKKTQRAAWTVGGPQDAGVRGRHRQPDEGRDDACSSTSPRTTRSSSRWSGFAARGRPARRTKWSRLPASQTRGA